MSLRREKIQDEVKSAGISGRAHVTLAMNDYLWMIQEIKKSEILEEKLEEMVRLRPPMKGINVWTDYEEGYRELREIALK